MTYSYSYEIGSTSTTTNLAALTVPVVYPKSSYKPFSQYISLGDGSVKGAGWVEATWHWDYITRTQRDQLKTFCSGASATVYIRTRTNGSTDAYAYLTGVLIWPEEEEKDAHVRRDFDIKFVRLVAFTPPGA